MAERDIICPSCHGRIKLPAHSRTFTLEQIAENHRVSCPARSIPRTKEEPS
jgi:hypothetical protein